MLLRHSTDICPKELTRGLRGYFNSLLALEATLGRAPAFLPGTIRESPRPDALAVTITLRINYRKVFL